MKENKKHKLIKNKGKLVPISFGIIMPIVSVISAVDNANKPPSGKNKKSNDKIQAVTTQTVQAPAQNGEVEFGKTPKKENFHPPVQAGFEFTFVKATPVDVNGISQVTYKVDINHSDGTTTTKHLTFAVSGFENKKQNDDTYNAKYKIVVTNDDNIHENQEFNYENKKEIIALKIFSAKKQVDLLKNLKMDSEKLQIIFKVDIDIIQKSNDSQEHALKLDDLEVITKEKKFKKCKSIYASWTEQTKSGDIAKWFSLKNSSDNDIRAQLKWVQNDDSTWNLQLFYYYKDNKIGEEDDSIYRYNVVQTFTKKIPSYNDKFKVIVTNDDDKKQKGFKKDIYDESNPEYVIVAKTWNTQEQIDLLINLKMDPERKNNIFKIDIDRIKSKYEFKSSAFTLEGLEEVTEEANFKKYGTIYAIWKNDTQNGTIANSFNLENHNHKNIIAKLKWIKNENETWNLKLSYDPDDYHGGEDDSIYRYKAQKISKTIPSYNEKSKVVATNDDNTQSRKFVEVDDKSGFKNVIVTREKENKEQVDLLQDLSFDQDKPNYFEVNIKKVKDEKSKSGDAFTLEDIKNKIFPLGNIEKVKKTYIKWDPSYKNQNSFVIYNDTITNAVGRNIELELKWEKNANNKWTLKLNYVSFEPNGSGEDDSIYIYKIKKVNLEEVKNEAKGFINDLSYPTQDDAKNNANLFGKIDKAKQTALTAIDNAKTPNDVAAMASSLTAGTEVVKVLAAIKEYKVKALQDAKNTAKEFINGLEYPKQDDKAHDAKLFGNIDKAKQAALTAINNAKTPQAIEAMALSPTAGTEVKKVLEAIKKYKDSTGTEAALKEAKTKAKEFINGLKSPTQDDAKHNASLFGNIAQAKQAALKAINAAKTPEVATAMASSKTIGTEVQKVLAAIKAYTDSTGTDVANAKTKAKAIINGLVYPAQDDARHDKNKFAAIGLAKTAALSQINGAATPEAATAMASSSTEGTEVEKVLAKIKIYTDSTGTDAEALENAKTKAKAIINGLVYPAQDDARHDKNKFAAIGLAKTAALSQINGAATPEAATAMASSSTEGTEVEKVLAKIKIYTDSTGTDAEALENAKTKAKAIINGLVYPAQDDARHDKNKFAAIGLAKTAALSQINGAATPEAATAMASSSTEGTEVEKVLAKIKIYTDSTGTDAEALENAKTKAKAIINGLVYPAQDDARHDKNKFAAIGLAKTAALSQINGAATPEAATAMASSSTEGTEVEKVLAKIKIYTDSTGTDAEALENAKTKAKEFINGLKSPTQDDAKHNASLFGNIAQAKQAALKAINAAKTPEVATAMASSKTEGSGIKKVLEAIKAYTDSTGTEAALKEAKDAAKEFINGLKSPTQDDAKHNASLFGNIAQAKQAALSAIDATTNPSAATAIASSLAEGTGVKKVLEAIKAYTDSTGTEAKALQEAKDAAKEFINGLKSPTQDDAKHNASLFGNIAQAKQAALSAIDATTNPSAATAIASSLAEGSGIKKVLEAIKAYTDSTGTEAALKEAKDAAKEFINGLKSPTQDDAKHNASLFGNIAQAKQAALSAIDATTNPSAATAIASSLAEGAGVKKVLEAIKAYTDSTGTIQALVDAKNTAKKFINDLPYPTQDDAKHNASLFGNIAKAKQAALKAINAAKTPEVATAMASSPSAGTELVKVKAAIDAYNKSTTKDKKPVSNKDKDYVKNNTTKKAKKSKTKIIIVTILSSIGGLALIVGIAYWVKKIKSK